MAVVERARASCNLPSTPANVARHIGMSAGAVQTTSTVLLSKVWIELDKDHALRLPWLAEVQRSGPWQA